MTDEQKAKDVAGALAGLTKCFSCMEWQERVSMTGRYCMPCILEGLKRRVKDTDRLQFLDEIGFLQGIRQKLF